MNVHSPAETPIETGAPEKLIDRGETGFRILLSLLFLLILRVAEAVLGVVILFSLLFALITQREVGAQVRRFANQVLSYIVVVTRYLTYNDDRVPFPFDEFPPELDYVPRSES